MSRTNGAKTRILVRVELVPEKGGVVFRYEPRPDRWRYDDCTVDDVLGRFNQVTERFYKKPLFDEKQQPNHALRRALQNELQVVLDALVDAGHIWCVDEGKAS